MLPLRLTLIFIIGWKYLMMEGLANPTDGGRGLMKYCHHILSQEKSQTETMWKTVFPNVYKDKPPFKPETENIQKYCNVCFNTKASTKFDFKPKDCSSLYDIGIRTSGIYAIYFRSAWMTEIKSKVYCDMETAGGGWTVIQRRGDFGTPHINFTRDWYNYSKGFGNLTEEFWLGNENIHRLSVQDNVTLRIELKGFDDKFHYANYNNFSVGGYKDDYKLEVGNYNGDAGDSLAYHNGHKFVTFDHNDYFNCSKIHKGGWWYDECMSSNLNGIYLENEILWSGVNWFEGTQDYHSYKWTEMKLRPKHFNPL